MKRDIARELFRAYRTNVRKKKEFVAEERSDLNEPQKISNILICARKADLILCTQPKAKFKKCIRKSAFNIFIKTFILIYM